MLVLFQLQYGEPVIRRAVPLALAILSASNPQLSIIDTLSKLSHDNDAEVSHNSIFAMGVVGAGQFSANFPLTDTSVRWSPFIVKVDTILRFG